MKAFLRNLLIGGIFAFVAAQAQVQAAAPTVVWTFSGLPLTLLFDSGNNFVGNPTGGLVAGGTMTFDMAGNLIDYNFVTNGHFPDNSPISTTYTYAPFNWMAQNDPGNTYGAWLFSAGDNGELYTLGLSLGGDINVAQGWSGPISPVSIVSGTSFESYSNASSPYDGSYRLADNVGGDLAAARVVGNLVATAVRVPEPASMALLGTGLLLLGFASRRRNRNSV